MIFMANQPIFSRSAAEFGSNRALKPRFSPNRGSNPRFSSNRRLATGHNPSIARAVSENNSNFALAVGFRAMRQMLKTTHNQGRGHEAKCFKLHKGRRIKAREENAQNHP